MIHYDLPVYITVLWDILWYIILLGIVIGPRYVFIFRWKSHFIKNLLAEAFIIWICFLIPESPLRRFFYLFLFIFWFALKNIFVNSLHLNSLHFRWKDYWVELLLYILAGLTLFLVDMYLVEPLIDMYIMKYLVDIPAHKFLIYNH